MDLSDIIGHESVKKMMGKWVEAPAFAYLFSGSAHLGKSLLAEKLVRALADHDVSKTLDVHPDIIIFRPEEGKKEVSVKSVRSARARLYESPQVASRMVVYLPRMDWLNQEGFNALLKVIEEPPAGAVFVGVAEQLSAIPATIFSRMVHIPLGIVAYDEIVKGLIARGKSKAEAERLAELSRGKPGLALNAEDILAPYRKIADEFVLANSLGARLAAIDSMRQKVESEEEPREAWVNALSACMDSIRAKLPSNSKPALILGQGIIDAIQALNGSIGPRVMLEASATLVEQSQLNLPSHLPQNYPLSLGNNQ
ncbi:MAG: hypothetical protein P1P90_06075 [Patescibacteria group bacterium]|nr:hypothetical protein [Patescibacteria group bacterium]